MNVANARNRHGGFSAKASTTATNITCSIVTGRPYALVGET